MRNAVLDCGLGEDGADGGAAASLATAIAADETARA